MRYNFENPRFWQRVAYAAESMGTDMAGLDRLLRLAEGTLEVFKEYDAAPDGEILRRITALTGMTEEELLSEEEPISVESPKNIFVYNENGITENGRSLDNALGRLYIDRPAGDGREYIGIVMGDESMSGAQICKGDIVIVRRQSIAESGDIVTAEVEGKAVIRRFNRKRDIIWLEAEGFVGEEPLIYTDNVNALNRKIKIRGKVVSLVRDFDNR